MMARATDKEACALYAQAAVMEAMGYKFDEKLLEARQRGIEEGWFSEADGSQGLGQPLAANGIPYETYWGESGNGTELIQPDNALSKLRSELEAGYYPIVSIYAPELSAYNGQHVYGHSLWVVGLELDAKGEVTQVVTNDSHWGEIQRYPVGEFLNAWGCDDDLNRQFSYYAVFAENPNCR